MKTRNRDPVRLFYSDFDGMSDQKETEDSVTTRGTSTITKSTWKRKRRKVEMAATKRSQGPDRVLSTSPLSSLANSRMSKSALTSSMETTAATSDRAIGSETNRGRGDRHDPGQDQPNRNPRRDHRPFAQSLTPTSATQSETGISSTEVTEEGGTVASYRSPSSSNKPWWRKRKERAGAANMPGKTKRAYRDGHKAGKRVEEAVKLYKSHWRVFN